MFTALLGCVLSLPLVRVTVADEAGRPLPAEVLVVANAGHADSVTASGRGADVTLAHPAAGLARVVVVADGHVPATRWLVQAGPTRLDVTLPAATTIGGRVLDVTGRPAAGARVWPGVATGATAGPGGWSFGYWGLGDLPAAAAVTDENGRWQSGHAPAAGVAVDVRIEHPDYALVFDRYSVGTAAAYEGRSVAVLRDRGRTVAGRVTEADGTPAAGAAVLLFGRRVATAGPDGSFRAPRMPSEWFNLGASLDGRSAATLTVFPHATKPVDLRLDPPAPPHVVSQPATATPPPIWPVTVRHADGTPAAGAVVLVLRPGGSASPQVQRPDVHGSDGVTRADGVAELSGASEESAVWVWHEAGYAAGRASGPLVLAPWERVPVTNVGDLAGTPAVLEPVRAVLGRAADGDNDARLTPGSATLRGIGGPARLRVYTPGQYAEHGPAEGGFDLAGDGVVTLRVTEPLGDGELLALARLTLDASGGEVPLSMYGRVADDGRVRLTNLRPGRYALRLAVNRPAEDGCGVVGVAERRLDVTVPAGGAVDLGDVTVR